MWHGLTWHSQQRQWNRPSGLLLVGTVMMDSCHPLLVGVGMSLLNGRLVLLNSSWTSCLFLLSNMLDTFAVVVEQAKSSLWPT